MKNLSNAIFVILMAAGSQHCDANNYEGNLILQGNEPCTILVLEALDGKTYQLSGSLSAGLKQHQQKHVIIRGKIIAPAAGPGFPAIIEVIKVIKINDR